jgi:hypothetical protein
MGIVSTGRGGVMKYTPEPDVPAVFTPKQIGTEVIYRIPNQAVLSQGIIAEFSPGRRFMRIGKRWLANQEGTVLAILKKKRSKRRTPYDQS